MIDHVAARALQRLHEAPRRQAVIKRDHRRLERAHAVRGAAVEADEEVELVHHRGAFAQVQQPRQRGRFFRNQLDQLLGAAAILGAAEQQEMRAAPALADALAQRREMPDRPVAPRLGREGPHLQADERLCRLQP
jgi:hypothetical protein